MIRAAAQKPGFAKRFAVEWKNRSAMPFRALTIAAFVMAGILLINRNHFYDDEIFNVLLLLGLFITINEILRIVVLKIIHGMARRGELIISKYNLWFYLLFDDNHSGSYYSNTIFEHFLLHIDKPQYLRSRIWWLSNQSSPDAIIGDSARELKLTLRREVLPWIDDPDVVLFSVGGAEIRLGSVQMVLMFVCLATIVFLFKLFFFLSVIFVPCFLLIIARNTSRLSFAAAYYKMLTDKWPWEK